MVVAFLTHFADLSSWEYGQKLVSRAWCCQTNQGVWEGICQGAAEELSHHALAETNNALGRLVCILTCLCQCTWHVPAYHIWLKPCACLSTRFTCACADPHHAHAGGVGRVGCGSWPGQRGQCAGAALMCGVVSWAANTCADSVLSSLLPLACP